MGTLSVMNSVQHRNGPNARPINSIFGSSGNSGQQLLSPALICGFSAAISCAVGFITYIKYSLNPQQELRGFGIEGIIIIAFVILPLLIGGILLITHRPSKQVLVVCVQPSITDEEIENWVVPPEASNGEGKPPSYDLALTMPKLSKKRADSLPPSYNNILIV